MTIGMHTLELATALVTEKRLEADRHRRWKITPAAGTTARATPGRERPALDGRMTGRQPRQA
jgi:hypothetical protein